MLTNIHEQAEFEAQMELIYSEQLQPHLWAKKFAPVLASVEIIVLTIENDIYCVRDCITINIFENFFAPIYTITR